MIPTARATDADVLVIATASIDADTIGALTTQAQEIGLRVRIVPQLHEMIDGVRHTDLREIRPEDLLGRRAVVTDLSERSEEHTSELHSRGQLVCRLLLEKK